MTQKQGNIIIWLLIWTMLVQFAIGFELVLIARKLPVIIETSAEN